MNGSKRKNRGPSGPAKAEDTLLGKRKNDGELPMTSSSVKSKKVDYQSPVVPDVPKANVTALSH